MTRLEQLRHDRFRAYLDDKVLMIVAYLFSIAAGVSALVSPPQTIDNAVGNGMTTAWGIAAVVGGSMALVSLWSAGKVIKATGGRASRYLVKYEVPGLRLLAISNAIYAVAVGITIFQTMNTGRLGQFFTVAIPAFLYWRELRRLQRVLRKRDGGSTDAA